MSKQSKIARARITQTPKTFSNWLSLLGAIAGSKIGRGPETLQFRTRSGVRIDCPNRRGARVPVYEIFAEDVYQLRPFLGPLLDRPIQVIDIGAHIGTFACRLTQLHPQASLMCFEPSPTTAQFLRRNVALNGIGDRVTVFERALARVGGHADFDDNGAGSGLNGLVSANHHTGTVTEVQTISFDDAVAAAPAPVDVVKIDCEGGEYDLVLGSSAASWASVQRVVIEYHPVPGQTWTELRAFFETVGLSVQAADEAAGYGCVWLSRDPITLSQH
jgi:FkbM family methyltransferase